MAFKETKYQAVDTLRKLQRRNDESTAREIGDVMTKNIGPSRELQAVQIVLKRSQTVNDVLMGVRKEQGSRRSSVGSVEAQGEMQRRRGGDDSGRENISSSDKRYFVLSAGTPALYLTHAETLADRERKMKEAQDTQNEKQSIARERRIKREQQPAERSAKRVECE